MGKKYFFLKTTTAEQQNGQGDLGEQYGSLEPLHNSILHFMER